MLRKGEIQAVSFDIDGTLFKDDERINDRIRNEISGEIMRVDDSFKTLEGARAEFERRYKEMQSGRNVLSSFGVPLDKAGQIIDDCIARADILPLLKRDERLAEVLEPFRQRYSFLGVVTSNTAEMATKKLRRLGLNPEMFDLGVYKDTEGAGRKRDGDAFKYLIGNSKIEADKHVYVGNSKSADIIPAREKRMSTIAVWSKIKEADISIDDIYAIGLVL